MATTKKETTKKPAAEPRAKKAEAPAQRLRIKVRAYEHKVLDASVKQILDTALRYDLGEGLLEIGLVLSSLYFISRKGMFPVLGIIAGIVGAGIAVTGFLI